MSALHCPMRQECVLLNIYLTFAELSISVLCASWAGLMREACRSAFFQGTLESTHATFLSVLIPSVCPRWSLLFLLHLSLPLLPPHQYWLLDSYPLLSDGCIMLLTAARLTSTSSPPYHLDNLGSRDRRESLPCSKLGRL